MSDGWSHPTLYGEGAPPIAAEPATDPTSEPPTGPPTAPPTGPPTEPPEPPPSTATTAGPSDAPPPDDARGAVHTALATGVHSFAAADLTAGGAGGAGGGADGWSAAVVQEAQRRIDDVNWGTVTYAGRGRRRARKEVAREPTAASEIPAPAPPAAPVAPAGPVAPAAPETPAARPTPDTPAARASAGSRGLLASSRTMAIASLVSRITGLLRTAAIAAVLGSTAVGIADPAKFSVSDPYNIANSLPNMVYELLVGGVLSSVLIPLIVYAQEHDHDRGEAYTQRLLSIATAVLGVATMLAVAAAPLITDVVVSGAGKRELTTIFATLLLPEIFFYGIGALIMAVLNSRNVYGPPAWAPVLNNVIVIAALGLFLFLPGGTPTIGGITDLQILVLGIGTTLGIVAQALVLLPSLRRSGFSWQWRFRAASAAETSRLGEVRTLALWVLGYVAASQVGVVVIQRVGSGASPIGYTIFTNADLLFQVPYGILGVSLLTALMPRMSRAAANNDLRAVVADLGLGTRLSALALVPITGGLIVLGPSLTTTILLGKFAPASAHEVGVVLALAAFGLLPFAVVMLQLRVFYAMRDARTPTLINLGMVGTKVVLILLATVVFDSPVAVVRALSVATSLSYVVGALVGHVLLRRRLGPLGFRSVGGTTATIAAASAVGTAVAALVVRAVDALVDGPRIGAITALLLGAALGGTVTAVTAWRLRIPELQDVMAAVRPSREPAAAGARNTGPAAVVERPAGAERPASAERPAGPENPAGPSLPEERE